MLEKLGLSLRNAWYSSARFRSQDDDKGAFVLNVVVEESLRGNGIGQALMAAATDIAIMQWEARRIYCHVDCANEASAAGCSRFGVGLIVDLANCRALSSIDHGMLGAD